MKMVETDAFNKYADENTLPHQGGWASEDTVMLKINLVPNIMELLDEEAKELDLQSEAKSVP